MKKECVINEKEKINDLLGYETKKKKISYIYI